MNFKELGVQEQIVKALHEQGIKEPTNIQEQAIPLVLAGKDLIGISKTGSGKTIAFGIPLLDKIEKGKGLQVLIMAPTRELAVQISQELAKFGKYTRPSIATVYGGVALDPQVQKMSKSEILVSTPGRLLDHLNRRNLDLSRIKCAVLDEADKMVEMGFIEDIEQILSYTPKDRQVLLFGATISSEVEKIKRKYMTNSVTAESESQVKEEFLEQYYFNCQPQEKFSLLVHLLKTEEVNKAIIFCSARSTVELVAQNLRRQGVKAEMLHGKMTQSKRLKVIEMFNQDRQDILVASAVAARGLHISHVSHVFNYDLSQDPQEYIHRVGRTARAGQSGKAFTLLAERDHGAFGDILRRFDVEVKELEKGEFPKLRFEFSGRNDREGFRSGNFRGGSGPQNRWRSAGKGVARRHGGRDRTPRVSSGGWRARG